MPTLRFASRMSACGVLVMSFASLAPAANAQDAGAGGVQYAAGMDLADMYMFRGVRQSSTGIVAWPFGHVDVQTYSGDGAVKRVGFGAGFWNSLNTGDTGSGGPLGGPWYESRVYGALDVRFAGGLAAAASYTSYVSPNELFSSVKEVGFQVAADDRVALAGVPIGPYALVAFEIGAEPGTGQLDGGLRGGTYLELGAIPRLGARHAVITVPLKVGVSLGDYYELGPGDNRFGFFSVAGIVSAPLGARSSLGQLSVRGGVEFQVLGATTEMFNGGNATEFITVFGVRLVR